MKPKMTQEEACKSVCEEMCSWSVEETLKRMEECRDSEFATTLECLFKFSEDVSDKYLDRDIENEERLDRLLSGG